MAKPVINVDDCEGCGSCEETCPEVFKLGDDEKATVIGPDKCVKKQLSCALLRQ
jgi:ferredoxin